MSLTNSDDALDIIMALTQYEEGLLKIMQEVIDSQPVSNHRVFFANKQGEDILEAIARHSDELDNIGAPNIDTHQDKEDLVWIEERIKEHQKKQVTQTTSINKPYYRSKERR